MLYRFLRRILRLILELYFVEVQKLGEENVPKEGALVFAANHPNSVMDPVLLGAEVERPISYLAKSGLFSNPIVAFVFKRCGVIPLYRKEDGNRDPNANDDTFRAAHELLQQGGTLGIFPEGQNAPERHVRDIKTGTARIALGAAARIDFAKNVKVVPIGINFVEREQHLTRVLLRFGEAMSTDDWRNRYENDSREAVRLFTDELQERMREQAVHVHELHHERLVREVFEVYGGEVLSSLFGSVDVRGLDEKIQHLVSGKETSFRDLDSEFLVQQHLADGIAFYEREHPDELDSLKRRLALYLDHLRQANLRVDWSTKNPEKLSNRMESMKMTLYALLLAPIAFWGFVHNVVPYLLTTMIALKAETEAMRAIRVLSFGILLFVLFYGAFGTVVFLAGASLPTLALYFLSLPFSGLWFLRYRRQISRYREKILLRTLFLTNRFSFRLLMREREALILRLDQMRGVYEHSLVD